MDEGLNPSMVMVLTWVSMGLMGPTKESNLVM